MQRLLRNQRGQATAEYALVLIAAATVALTLIVWASGTDLLPAFFDGIIKRISGVARSAGLG